MDKSKIDAYKKYGWGEDSNWQNYVGNLYPTPSRERYEKIRRKWYKKSVDKDFDVDFNAQEEEQKQQQQQPRQSDQQRFYQQYQQQYQQQNPGAAHASRQSNYPDKMPQLRQLQTMLWCAYLISYPLGFYTTIFAVVVNLVGMGRKAGMPNTTNYMQYLQEIAFVDEFHNLTYIMSTMAAPGGIFVNAPVVISAVLYLIVEAKKIVQNTSIPILSNATVKDYILKGASVQTQEYGRLIKSDVEVYCGFYLIGMVFLGGANFLSVMVFWQMMRVRYMVNPGTQQAFSRIDQNLSGWLNHSMCPGAISSGYQMMKGYLSNMVNVQAQQQQYQSNQQGGIMGTLRNSCNIF